MKCPVDNTTLTIAERQGVEIDYCPSCRGVWLDRGELDKLIERSEQFDGRPAPRHNQPMEQRYQDHAPRRHHDDDDDDRHEYQDRNGHHGKHHKKESFLGDLFDF